MQLQAGLIFDFFVFFFPLEICSFFWIVELFLPTERRENSNLFSVVHKRKPLSPWQDFSGELVNNLLEPNPLGSSLRLPVWFNLQSPCALNYPLTTPGNFIALELRNNYN